MGKGFFNHSSSNKKQLLELDGNNLSISGGNTVQLPLGGEANFNGFFPNGIELIQESRDFLQSDVGKLLILGGGPVPFELTMPNTMPFEVGDIIGILSVQSSNNYQPAYDEDKIFPNHHGTAFGEVLILQCDDFTSIGGIKILVPISTSTIYDSKDNKNKTLYRYILDNLGNSILFPNGIQFLGSGEHEYTADMAGKFIAIHNETKLIKPIGGYPFQNGDLICISLNDTDKEGTFSLTNYDNIKLLNGEYIILYALDVGGGTIDLFPFSTPIIQDGEDENHNAIWKTANRYFKDNIGGSQIAFTKTKAEIDALIAGNDLVAGALYEITGVHPTLYDDGTTSGTTIILKAISENVLETQGTGIFYNPKYNQAVDGFGIWDNKMYGTFSTIVGTFDYQNKETVTADNGATGILLADGMIQYVSGNWSSAISITGCNGKYCRICQSILRSG